MIENGSRSGLSLPRNGAGVTSLSRLAYHRQCPHISRIDFMPKLTVEGRHIRCPRRQATGPGPRRRSPHRPVARLRRQRRCRTCRVEFISGELATKTPAETAVLTRREFVGHPSELPNPLRSRHGSAGDQPICWQRTEGRGPRPADVIGCNLVSVEEARRVRVSTSGLRPRPLAKSIHIHKLVACQQRWQ